MCSAHQFYPTILREYDIRGIVGQTLTAAAARAIGRGFGSMLRARGGQRAALGFDGRLSSPRLHDAVAEGLRAAGVDVTSVGMGPTPMLYFASHVLDVDGGIMITGSHNPPDYNGFKMVMLGKSFFGDDIQALGALMAAGDVASGDGGFAKVDLRERYRARLAEEFAPAHRLKIVWDCGNGAAGDIVTALTAGLAADHTVLFGGVDGTLASASTVTATASVWSTIRAASSGATNCWPSWPKRFWPRARAPPSSPMSRPAKRCLTVSPPLAARP